MTIDTKLLVPMAEANQNFSRVVHLVEGQGMAVILKNNKPRYVVVDFSEYESIRAAMQLRQGEQNTADTQPSENTKALLLTEDPLLSQVIELGNNFGKLSTSILQRHFSIGYGRAARILDRMEALGYISPAEGCKPRRMLIRSVDTAQF